ncbi:MAG: O-antigen ligase family protein [Bdellovibrionales bacterium]|nr:O-antigen ligase family protein [Bdellovibrionales bacterium]
MSRKLKDVLILIPFIGVLKRVLLKKTFFQVLPVAFGYADFLRNKFRVVPASVPLALMVAVGIIPILKLGIGPEPFFRLLQLLGMILFMSYLVRNLRESHLTKLISALLIIHVLTLALDLVWGSTPWRREFFGISIYRFPGIVGEPNFSSALLVGLLGISLALNQKGLAAASFLSILPTWSRAGILGSVLLATLHFVRPRLSKRTQMALGLVGTLGFLLAPFLIHILFQFSSPETATRLSSMSPRFFQIPSYVDLAIDNPLGVGYRQGGAHVRPYVDRNMVKVDRSPMYSEQHNLYVQVISEFGFLGFILFGIFLVTITKRSSLNQFRFLPVWLTTLFMFSFTNGLSELIFYLAAACTYGLATDKNS